MLDAAIVPEGHRVLLPGEPVLKEGILEMLEEVGQKGVALFLRQAVDPRREATIDVKRLAPRARVGARYGVIALRVFLTVLDAKMSVSPAVDELAIVQRR